MSLVLKSFINNLYEQLYSPDIWLLRRTSNKFTSNILKSRCMVVTSQESTAGNVLGYQETRQ